VGVQLRIGGPTRVLVEQRRHQPLGIDLVDAISAPSGHRAVAFQPIQRRVDGGVMGGGHLGVHPGVGAERP
jgi:hypothetical protein